MTVIDAHLHLWDLATGDYGWNTAALGPVHRTFTADEAGRALASAGVDRAVLVQAADTRGDTGRMLAVARSCPWVAGVVGWVPLQDPPAARTLLDEWSASGRLVGVRMLVHDHPRADLLDDPAVRASVAEIGARGLPLDLPDAWPRLWPAVMRLVDAAEAGGASAGVSGGASAGAPDRFVLDHLGKPGAGLVADAERFGRWRRDLRELARRDGVVAKVSGLGAALSTDAGTGTPAGTRSGAGAMTADAVRPLIDVALEAFGPSRLMMGSDWPVSVPGGTYAEVVDAVRGCLAALSADERDAVLGGTARRVYALA